MAQSLNNHKAEDFMKRTSSFSTHGSRRGWVDDGLHIRETDWNREALILQKLEKSNEIAKFREKYQISRKVSIKDLVVPRPHHHNSNTDFKNLKRKRFYTFQELEKVRRLAAEVKELEKQIALMPKTRNLTNNKQQLMLEILNKRSPELYRAIEREAQRMLAREAAQPAKPDAVQKVSLKDQLRRKGYVVKEPSSRKKDVR